MNCEDAVQRFLSRKQISSLESIIYLEGRHSPSPHLGGNQLPASEQRKPKSRCARTYTLPCTICGRRHRGTCSCLASHRRARAHGFSSVPLCSSSPSPAMIHVCLFQPSRRIAPRRRMLDGEISVPTVVSCKLKLRVGPVGGNACTAGSQIGCRTRRAHVASKRGTPSTRLQGRHAGTPLRRAAVADPFLDTADACG